MFSLASRNHWLGRGRPAQDFNQHHSQHQVGTYRRHTGTEVEGKQRRQVQLFHRLHNLSCRMVRRNLLVPDLPLVRSLCPRRIGELNMVPLARPLRAAYHRVASLHLGADRCLDSTSLHKPPKCREVNYFTIVPRLPRKLDDLFIAGSASRPAPSFSFFFRSSRRDKRSIVSAVPTGRRMGLWAYLLPSDKSLGYFRATLRVEIPIAASSSATPCCGPTCGRSPCPRRR